MMPQEKTFTTSLIAKEVKAVNSGTSQKGQKWTLWQVIATKVDGTSIEQNLRSFVELPVNEVIEVECELFESEQYGPSYTLKPKAGTGRTKRTEDLEKRVDRIEEWVKANFSVGLDGQAQTAGARSQAPPPSVPAEAPPPVEPESNVEEPIMVAPELPVDETVPF